MTDDPSAEPATLRLFVAAEIPDDWRTALDRLQEELRLILDSSARLRWVRPEGIHLTLKFLGQAATNLRPAIEGALARAVPAPLAISLRPGAIGSFGDRGRLRVLWFGVDGHLDELASVARRIDQEVHALGFTLERRTLAPHLTLARVPDGLGLPTHQAIYAALKAAPAFEFAPFEVSGVSLISSKLGPGGAHYETIARFPATETLEK